MKTFDLSRPVRSGDCVITGGEAVMYCDEREAERAVKNASSAGFRILETALRDALTKGETK